MRTRKAYVHMHLQGAFVPAGLLTVVEDGRRSSCAFQYGNRYLERADAVAVDPVQLPLAGAKGHRFDGPSGGDLFGGMRDASPDAWGRHVLDRSVEHDGLQLTELDYLLMAGPDRIGALGFSTSLDEPPFATSTFAQTNAAPTSSAPVALAPSVPVPSTSVAVAHAANAPDATSLAPGASAPAAPGGTPLPGAELDLAALLAVADAVDNEETLEPRFRRFLVRGSSLGGARPKAAVTYEGRHWIAKFDRRKEAWPTCRVEHACLRLAAQCGIEVPRSRLVRVMGDREILLIERFDRRTLPAGVVRVPFVSAATMTGLTQSQVLRGGSYPALAAAMRRHCRADTLLHDLARLYRRMVFNAMVNNTDDHLRNHGFLFDRGGWSLSPAYDVVPQPVLDPAARALFLAVGEHGRMVSEAILRTAGGPFGLSDDEAAHVVDEVKQTIAGTWERQFKEAGVPDRNFPELRRCLALAVGTGA